MPQEPQEPTSLQTAETVKPEAREGVMPAREAAADQNKTAEQPPSPPEIPEVGKDVENVPLIPSTPTSPALPVDALLKNPQLIHTLSPEAQLKSLLDLVVERNFSAAHDFIERLGKKDDLAFYAWLEDMLHDAALQEDWRKFIETQK